VEEKAVKGQLSKVVKAEQARPGLGVEVLEGLGLASMMKLAKTNVDMAAKDRASMTPTIMTSTELYGVSQCQNLSHGATYSFISFIHIECDPCLIDG